MAYSKQTWDTTSYVNPTRMNHIEDGIKSVDLTEGGSVHGNLAVVKPSTTTAEQITWIQLGNNTATGSVGNATGKIALYGDKTSSVILQAVENMTSGSKTIKFPDKDGTVALNPTKTQFTPNYGSSSSFANRNFFVTDNATFLDIHFCLYCGTAINANVDLITLPTIAQNKLVQYGVGVETSNNKAHLVYNSGNYLYLDGSNITANSNGVFSGTFRMSLI